MSQKDFQHILLEAVDDTFSSLGESAKQAIYYHLKTKFKMPRDEIPSRLKEFEDGLEKIFGVGTRFLEIMMMKKLNEKVQLTRKTMKWDEEKEFNFTGYVSEAEKTFLKRKKASE